jgi:hypothetical protein
MSFILSGIKVFTIMFLFFDEEDLLFLFSKIFYIEYSFKEFV